MIFALRPKSFRLVSRLCQSRGLASLSPTSVLSKDPFVVKPSKKEITSGLLDARHLEQAVRSIHQDGLVVVEDVVPHEHLDFLNKKMVQDARTLQARGKDSPFNYNPGNIQLDAPPVAEYMMPSIFTNHIASQITSSILGPLPKWTFCSANAAMPPLPEASPQRQPVHSDADFAHPSHPFALVVNIPLVTMTPHNGSTEIWLGTHNHGVEQQEGAHGERASGRINEASLTGQKAVRGPCQPEVKKGSIVIRDLRLWHAGMPNHSDEVRVMLAMIHFAPWYRNQMRLSFAEDVKPILGNLSEDGRLGLDVSAVDWLPRENVLGRGGYLDRGFGNSYDFDQSP